MQAASHLQVRCGRRWKHRHNRSRSICKAIVSPAWRELIYDAIMMHSSFMDTWMAAREVQLNFKVTLYKATYQDRSLHTISRAGSLQ